MIWTIIITPICAGWFCGNAPYVFEKRGVEAESYRHCIEQAADLAYRWRKDPDRYTINCKRFDPSAYTVK